MDPNTGNLETSQTVRGAASLLSATLLPPIFGTVSLTSLCSFQDGHEHELEHYPMTVCPMREGPWAPNDIIKERALRLRAERPCSTAYPMRMFNEDDLVDEHGKLLPLENYIQRLEALSMTQKQRNPSTLEDIAVSQARLLAAQDHALMQAEPRLVDPEYVENVMRMHYAGEVALRDLRNMSLLRPDWRPPRFVSTSPMSSLILGIISDDLMARYIGPGAYVRHGRKSGKSEDSKHARKYAPGVVLQKIADSYEMPLDVMFPVFSHEDNPGLFENEIYSTKSFLNRARIISIGLIPLVMAHMDPRFLALNPILDVCQYVANYVKPLLATRFNVEVYQQQYEQLEHNMRWISSVSQREHGELALATRLPGFIHGNLIGRMNMRLRAEVSFWRSLVPDDEAGCLLKQQIKQACETYTNSHIGIPAVSEDFPTGEDPFAGHILSRIREEQQKAENDKTTKKRKRMSESGGSLDEEDHEEISVEERGGKARKKQKKIRNDAEVKNETGH